MHISHGLDQALNRYMFGGVVGIESKSSELSYEIRSPPWELHKISKNLP